MSDIKKTRPITCVVTSDKMQNSRVGEIERLVKHRRYQKYIKRTTRIMFHDAENQTKLGDKVLIEPSRPFSARKRFNLVKVIESASE